MVRCAMCDSPAITEIFVLEQGNLAVCSKHFSELSTILIKKTIKGNMKDILTKILKSLNEHYIKVPLVQAPTRKFENNGIRAGLKMAIAEVETELEKLIKK